MNVSPGKRSDLYIRCTMEQSEFLNLHEDLVKSLAKVENISSGTDIVKPKQSATSVVTGMELYIPLQGLVDLEEEKRRMTKRISEIDRLLGGINSKLSNENFLKRAPEWLKQWTGIRIDSGDPVEGAEAAIAWWKNKGENPKDKLVIFSDGLDTTTIRDLHQKFNGRVKVSFGVQVISHQSHQGIRYRYWQAQISPFSVD